MWRLNKGPEFLAYVSLQKLQTMYSHEKNAKAKLRLLAAIRRKKGESIDDIAFALEKPRRTIHGWLHRFEQRRLDAVHDKKQSGRPTKLTQTQLKELRRQLLKSTTHKSCRLWTTKDVREHLKTHYGVVYRRSNIFRLLHSLGLSLQKPRQQHYKSDKNAQEEFKKKLDESVHSIEEKDGRLRVWMNPQWGKFVQIDLLLPNIYDPQQLNRYSYVRNNPYKYHDENGKHPAIALMLVGFVAGTLSYAAQHAGQVPISQLPYHLSKAVVHGGIGAAAGLAVGLSIGSAAAGVGHIAASSTLKAGAVRLTSGLAESIGHDLLDEREIDLGKTAMAGILSLPGFGVAGSKAGTFYSATSLTSNSFQSAKQYAWGNGIGSIATAVYDKVTQWYNLNSVNQASQVITDLANQAKGMAGTSRGSSRGPSGGSSSSYSWGVEEVGNTKQLVVVIPVKSSNTKNKRV